MRGTTLLIAFCTIVSLLASSADAQRPEGPRGNSNVVQMTLDNQGVEGYEDAGGLVTVKVFDDGTVEYVLNAKDLPEGDYVVKALGSDVGAGSANRGGNLHVRGSFEADTSPFQINVWAGDDRILRSGEIELP